MEGKHQHGAFWSSWYDIDIELQIKFPLFFSQKHLWTFTWIEMNVHKYFGYFKETLIQWMFYFIHKFDSMDTYIVLQTKKTNNVGCFSVQTMWGLY